MSRIFDSVREAICDYHPDFVVTAHSWPSFLYEDGIYDANNPSNGLFKGSLLVTVRRLSIIVVY